MPVRGLKKGVAIQGSIRSSESLVKLGWGSFTKLKTQGLITNPNLRIKQSGRKRTP